MERDTKIGGARASPRKEDLLRTLPRLAISAPTDQKVAPAGNIGRQKHVLVLRFTSSYVDCPRKTRGQMRGQSPRKEQIVPPIYAYTQQYMVVSRASINQCGSVRIHDMVLFQLFP